MELTLLIKNVETIHSLIVAELDEDDKVKSFEDRWDGKAIVDRWGSGVGPIRPACSFTSPCIY